MQGNIKDKTIFCHDNLEVLRGMNSESVDLIYLDPPFNKKKTFTAPIGSSAEGASFKDIFKAEDIKDEWLKTIEEDHLKLFVFLEATKNIEGRSSYNFCYLSYMSIRLIECHRVLKSTGSIYYHCDPTMSHYIKIAMDCIFGYKNFRNEIVWKRTSSHNDGKRFGKILDSLLFFTKSSSYFFSPVFNPHNKDYLLNSYNKKDEKGLFKAQDLTGPGINKKDLPWRGWNPQVSGRSWAIPNLILGKYLNKADQKKMSAIEKLDFLESKNRIYFTKNGSPLIKYYKDDTQGKKEQCLWDNINSLSSQAKERTGYPTQKPLALLERIIKASSKEGDVVLDPFCGCATTCVASEKLKRKWIGIDISIKAYDLVKIRLAKDVEFEGTLFHEKDKISCKIIPPKRTDLGENYEEKKSVYVISNPKYINEYKVGITSDPKSRVKDYQTGDPDRSYKLRYYLTTKTPIARKLEKHIHLKFPNKHEWVSGDFLKIKEEMIRYSQLNP